MGCFGPGSLRRLQAPEGLTGLEDVLLTRLRQKAGKLALAVAEVLLCIPTWPFHALLECPHVMAAGWLVPQ